MKRNLRIFLTLYMMFTSLVAFAQQRTISGKVIDSTGESVPGVSIVVKGTTNGTITNIDGDYQLGNVPSDAILVFSFIGYDTQEIPLAEKSIIDVTLSASVQDIDEVVVVGYGTMKKSDLTGAVASVGGETLEKVASNRPVEAMQGRVAGVNITKSSGNPGAGMKVRIRGVGSTNNSDPLYVIDGVPSGSDMEHVAPEDIESIEVLKDASATAIYGNKGANGVIIVTTKSGSVSDKPVFSFNSYVGVGELANKVDMLNATEQATLIMEAADNDGTTIPDDLAARINYVLANNAEGTDWQDEIFRTGIQQNYNLSVRGGVKSDKVDDRQIIYSLSGTYYDEEGIVENTNFSKYMFNSKTEYQFNKRVKVGVQLDIFHKENGDFPQGLYSGPIPLALKTSPMDRGVDDDGNFISTATTLGQNPALAVDHMKYVDNTTNSYGLRSWLDLDIVDGLNFKTTFYTSKGFTKVRNYKPSYYLNENFYRTDSELYESRGEWNSWTWINLLNYNKTFGTHRVNATLGHEAAFNDNAGFGGTGINVPQEESLRYLNLAKTYKESLGAWQGQTGTESYFARGFYSYADKYMVTATARYDGSSKFSGDNKWGFFPSLGASWRASEESFIKDLDIFSNLKVRAGWGRVGNEASAQAGSNVANIGNYGMYYVFNDVAYKGGTTTNIPTDLKWEIVETTNLGLDMGLLQGDLNVTADYFIKDTKDMITRVALPGYYPKDRPNANIGTIRNEGFELSANYSTKIGDVRLNFGGNISVIENEVQKLNDDEDAFIDGGYVDKLGNTTRTESGYEIAYFYGYQTNGIFKSQEEIDAHSKDGALIQPNAKVGDVRFVDNNDNGAIDADDRAYLGSGTPDFTYGFNISAEYKSFDFSANVFGMQGNEIVNGMSIFTMEVKDYTNAYASRLNRFHPTNNPNGTEPRVTLADNNNNTQFSDRYVQDGSYLRLKNVQLGYTLPKSLTQKINVDKVRFYVSGQNLLTLTDYDGFDPEIGDLTHDAASDAQSLGVGVDLGNYPQPRLYYFGVNVTF